MRMVLDGPRPQEVDDLLARRRARGLDTYDEVWNGEYHSNPSPNRRHARIQARLVAILSPLYRHVAVGLVGPVRRTAVNASRQRGTENFPSP